MGCGAPAGILVEPPQPRSPRPHQGSPERDTEHRRAGLGASLITPGPVILTPFMKQQKCGTFSSHTVCPVMGRVSLVFRKSNISQSYFSILSSLPSLPVHPCQAHVSFTGYEDGLCIPEFDPKIAW